MRKFIKSLAVLMSLLSVLVFSLVIYGQNAIPDSITVMNNNAVFSEIYTVKSGCNSAIAAINSNALTEKSINAEIRLFNSIPVKNVSLNQSDRRYVCVGGDLIGIRIKSDGVLVVGTEKFNSENGSVDPAEKAGITIGDTIVKVNGNKIASNKDLTHYIESSDGKNLSLEVRRNNKTIFLTLKPEKSNVTGKYKSGLWIRDSTGGIGTLTFADIKNGTFASLGHGIYDVDTNSLLTSSGGTLYTAKLSGITKGCNGIAGELRGSIGSETLGEVFINCENGIYGSISKNFSMEDIMPVAFNNEVKVGKAQIISTVNNQKTVFDIEIEKIDMNTENKNMIIKITDKELIDTTGGIVQGMSGSPIIQNDKFVGAVTHVFLNDPTKGYAILAENMLEVSDSLVLTEDNKAA